MPAPTLHVAVGVIVNSDHEVLISKRSSDVHQANRWEFPGGKIESDESIEAALSRELKEELGITVLNTEFLTSIEYDYGDKIVHLHIHLVNDYSGEPSGIEGQPVQWVKADELQDYHFPDANLAIINLLQLPDVIQITGCFSSLPDLISKSKRSFARGVRILQFRANDLDDETYTRYAEQLLKLCHQHNIKLILNRTLEILQFVNADGLHLNRYEMKKYNKRPCSMEKIFSVSCHNENELRQAEKLSADYCFLSPVKQAFSHDAGQALGMEVFSYLVSNCTTPVYALGGMSGGDLEEIKRLKGKGIATVSDNWLITGS